MHWSELLKGAELYPQDKFDKTYSPFSELPRQAELRTASERLVKFINSWGTRSPMSPRELLEALQRSYGGLQRLASLRIETLAADGDGDIEKLIAEVFDSIAQCGGRTESTGASKILHSLLPNLFVMWDMRIASGYGLQPRPTGREYARTFLPRVICEMDEALRSYADDRGCTRAEAVEQLMQLGDNRTMPKLLDQYNYVKFTTSSDELWRRQ